MKEEETLAVVAEAQRKWKSGNKAIWKL